MIKRPATEPFGQRFRTEPLIADQPREALSRRLLVALRPRQLSLAMIPATQVTMALF